MPWQGWRRRFLIGALFLTVVALLLMIVYAAGASNRLNLVNDLRNAAAWLKHLGFQPTTNCKLSTSLTCIELRSHMEVPRCLVASALQQLHSSALFHHGSSFVFVNACASLHTDLA